METRNSDSSEDRKAETHEEEKVETLPELLPPNGKRLIRSTEVV